MLRRWSGPCVPSRVWREGEWRKHERGGRWENTLQPIRTLKSPNGKGYSSPPPPPPVAGTVIFGHFVFHIYITQHTICKLYNLLALHLAVWIFVFKELLQPPNPTQSYWKVVATFKKMRRCVNFEWSLMNGALGKLFHTAQFEGPGHDDHFKPTHKHPELKPRWEAQRGSQALRLLCLTLENGYSSIFWQVSKMQQ